MRYVSLSRSGSSGVSSHGVRNAASHMLGDGLKDAAPPNEDSWSGDSVVGLRLNGLRRWRDAQGSPRHTGAATEVGVLPAKRQ